MPGCGWTQPAQCPPTFFMICPPPANAGGQAQAQFPTWPPQQCLPPTLIMICPPAANAGGGQAQAQFPTLSCTIPVVCAITYIAGCNGQAQAQAQTMYHTQIGCPVSVPPHCPTVAPMCPPPQQNTAATVCTQIGCPAPGGNGGGQAQAQMSFPTLSCTIPVVCAITQIAGCGNQAQAQFPTLNCTFPIVCDITRIAGCSGQAQAQAQFPTLPPLCPMTSPPMCPVTITCPPANGSGGAGGQAQMSFPTLSCTFPVVCAITQIAGCGNQAQAQTMYHTQIGCSVSVPTQCPTVAPMCQVTQWQCPPAASQNVSVPPHCPTVAPMCPVTQVHCQLSAPPHCPTVASCGGSGGQAQAQTPTIPVVQCIVPTMNGCTGIWPIC
jgi:hypothetical protein